MTKYEKIKEDIKEKIVSKELHYGDRVPSEFQLCETYGVSRITAKRALDELNSSGYIKRVNGSGSYVSFRPIDHLLTDFYSLYDEIRKNGMEPSSKLVELNELSVSQSIHVGEIKAQMLLHDYEHVYLIKRLRYADEDIIALDYTYIPVKFAPILSEQDFSDPSASLFVTLRNRFGIVPDRAQEYFGVCAVKQKDASLLQVTPESPGLVIMRVSYTHGSAVEFNYRICKGENFRFRVDLQMH